jgi:5-methylcytosine-specific restriction endonuclease McrA
MPPFDSDYSGKHRRVRRPVRRLLTTEHEVPRGENYANRRRARFRIRSKLLVYKKWTSICVDFGQIWPDDIRDLHRRSQPVFSLAVLIGGF